MHSRVGQQSDATEEVEGKGDAEFTRTQINADTQHIYASFNTILEYIKES